MQFGLSEEQELIRRTVREFAEKEIAPRARQSRRPAAARRIVSASGCSSPSKTNRRPSRSRQA